MYRLSFVALLGSVALSSAGSATVVTTSNPDGWSAANVRSEGSVAITGTYAPSGQSGSLEFNTNSSGPGSSQDKADYVKYWGNVTGRTLGNISALSYSYYRDSSSTTGAWLAPALRLAYDTGVPGETGYLIFEPVYNGNPVAGPAVPTNQWVDKDILNSNFWMREFSPGTTVETYNVTLAQWASDTSQAAGADVLSANTRITGIEVGVGSGWGGSFKGAADNVLLTFSSPQGTADTISADFEPAAVPEPATWAMMIVGFGAVGATMRRRSSRIRFAA